MTDTTNQHGGPRKGAGRPPKPNDQRYQQYPLKLPPDIVKWLKGISNRNGFIVEAIREKINRAS